ncbi:MAG: hypothetical protein ACJ8FT_01430 [Sphingomonas sp.]
MARVEIRLGPGECSNIESGARYFAALAFPTPCEAEDRCAAEFAKAALYLHDANRVDESDSPFEDPRLNKLVALDPQWCRARVRTMYRRLKDRADVARAVRPWMLETFDEPHRPMPGIKKFTQRQISLYLCGGDVTKSDNFQKRVWRPSRAALHMAIAQDLALSLLDIGQSVNVDLASIDLIKAMADFAERLVPKLCSDRRFGVGETELLRLQWVA